MTTSGGSNAASGPQAGAKVNEPSFKGWFHEVGAWAAFSSKDRRIWARPILTIALILTSACAAETPLSPSTGPTTRVVTSLDDQGRNPMEIRVLDPRGETSDASAATIEQIARATPDLLQKRIAVNAVAADPRQVVVVWTGFSCDRSGSFSVGPAPGVITVAPDPVEGCELVPSYRGVVLSFPVPVDAGSLKVILNPTEVLGA